MTAILNALRISAVPSYGIGCSGLSSECIAFHRRIHRSSSHCTNSIHSTQSRAVIGSGLCEIQTMLVIDMTPTLGTIASYTLKQPHKEYSRQLRLCQTITAVETMRQPSSTLCVGNNRSPQNETSVNASLRIYIDGLRRPMSEMRNMTRNTTKST